MDNAAQIDLHTAIVVLKHKITTQASQLRGCSNCAP